MIHVKTREQCVARYGHIDFASRHWPEQAIWIKSLHIPDGMFPNWHVLDTQLPVRSIACNIDIHQPLLQALTAIHDKGLGANLHTFDGCFNIRLVRGSNTHFSAHSYGLALDLNAKTNALGATQGGFYDLPELVKSFKDAGFAWGGDFHGRRDPMHMTWPGW